MRAGMVAADADGELFKATLAKAVQAKIFRGPLTAIIDSSPARGGGGGRDLRTDPGFLVKIRRAGGLKKKTADAVALLAGGKPGRTRRPVRRTWASLSLWPRRRWPRLADTTDPAVREQADLLAQVRSSTAMSTKTTTATLGSATAWPATGSSAIRIRRCATAASRRRGVSTVTSSTSSPTRTPN